MMPKERGELRPRKAPPGSDGFVPFTREFGSDTWKSAEIDNSSTKNLSEAQRGAVSRRSVLTLVFTLGAAAPFGMFGAARALTASGTGSLSYIPGEPFICRV